VRRRGWGWRAAVAVGRPTLQWRPPGSVFFPEACSVDVSFRRVCKHAARLRAAPEVEYVSTSTGGRVRHFRRVCMPASTCEFGGGGYVLQSCCGCRGICTSVLHGLVLGFCMRVFSPLNHLKYQNWRLAAFFCGKNIYENHYRGSRRRRRNVSGACAAPMQHKQSMYCGGACAAAPQSM
jgi:hypothetical protein